jgi:hypothetical protein
MSCWRWWWLRPQFCDAAESLGIFAWDGSLGHPEDHIAVVPDELRPILILQACKRPILDRLRHCPRAQKIAEVIGKRVKLEPHCFGGECSA